MDKMVRVLLFFFGLFFSVVSQMAVSSDWQKEHVQEVSSPMTLEGELVVNVERKITTSTCRMYVQEEWNKTIKTVSSLNGV